MSCICPIGTSWTSNWIENKKFTKWSERWISRFDITFICIWNHTSHILFSLSWAKWDDWEKILLHCWSRIGNTVTYLYLCFYRTNLYIFFLINILPTSILYNKCPIDMLFNQKPDYQFLKVFSRECFLCQRSYTHHKLEPQFQSCTFLGYSS